MSRRGAETAQRLPFAHRLIPFDPLSASRLRRTAREPADQRCYRYQQSALSLSNRRSATVHIRRHRHRRDRAQRSQTAANKGERNEQESYHSHNLPQFTTLALAYVRRLVNCSACSGCRLSFIVCRRTHARARARRGSARSAPRWKLHRTAA